MSTKSSIFLTKDNEHCYTDFNEPFEDENGNYIGDILTIEMSKKNATILDQDEDGIIIEIKPGCELYDLIRSIKQK